MSYTSGGTTAAASAPTALSIDKWLPGPWQVGGPGTTVLTSATASEGRLERAARVDHDHSTTGLSLLNAVALGVSKWETAAPPVVGGPGTITQAYDDVANEGRMERGARVDHKHGMPAAGASGAPTYLSLARWGTD